jgi:Kef-type K+ transport system membrane component KefB
MKITKAFVIVTAIVTLILLGVFSILGGEITPVVYGYVVLFSAIFTAAVMVIWFIVGMWVSGPVIRFLNRTFELMGR